MSKNLTRKGLALGAIVALGSSLFAGAPAFAAGTASDGITLAPNAGTTYSTIAGTKFDLANTALSGALVAQYGSNSAANLSFLVTNSAAATLKFGFDGANGSTVNTYDAWTAASAADVTGSKATTADSTDLSAKAIVVTGSSTDQGVNTSVAGKKNHLFITSDVAATSNVVVDVQAFLDENGNGKIDSSDLVSPVRTLTFVPVANVSATTSVTSAVIGSNKLQASVVFGGDINAANLPATAIVFEFKENGTVINVGGSLAPAASWDSTDLVTKNLLTNFAGVSPNTAVAAKTYTAQAYLGSVATANKLGTTGTAVTPVAGTNVSVDAIDDVAVSGSANAKKSTGADTIVRSGFTGDVTFTSTVKSAGAALKVAGNTVKVTLSATALDATTKFVAGGQTLTSTSGDVSFTTTTAADGTIKFTGASSTGKADDKVTVTVNPLTTTGYVSAKAQSTAITYTKAAATSFVGTNLVGNGAVVKTTVAGSYGVSYAVVDQFGQALSTGVYRVELTTVSPDNNANITVLVDGVAGKFTKTVADNSTKAGQYTLRASLFKQNDVLAWVTAGLADVDEVVYVNSKAAATLGATAAPTTAVATETTALAAVDLTVDSNSQKAPAYTSANKFTVSGTVRDADGSGVAGAVVSLSGTGLGFVVNSTVYTIGSATVNANAQGEYSVDVYSNTAGKASVVVTSGAATKTAAIEFTGVTTLDAKGTITLDVASLSQVGRSVTVNILVKDSLGNPVKSTDLISVSVTGVGSLSASKVSTDATGKASVQFVAGANDFGDAVIVAKYTNSDDTVVSATKTLTVGVTDAQVDIVGKRVTAVTSFSKGKTVAFYVDGIKKWSKISSSDADVVLNYNLKKGTHTVTVKVSGGFVTTEKFIVK
jgi:hypothetical protein